MQVPLPGDQWAELIEPDDLRDGDRKAVMRAVKIPQNEDQEVNAGFLDDIYDALLPLVITNWSFQVPLPRDVPVSLDTLTIKQARELRKAVKPHYDVVMGADGAEDPTGSGDSGN